MCRYVRGRVHVWACTCVGVGVYGVCVGAFPLQLVMDLSALNKFIKHIPFKMVTVAQVRTSLRRGDWLASIDLKDAYWHVPIHPRFRKFLAFQVGELTYQFTRLPFGLSLAPRVFTKLTRVVATRLAEKGVTSLMYIDDWLPRNKQQPTSRQPSRFWRKWAGS